MPEPTEREKRDGAWAILRASKDLREHGHHRAISWARGYLGLEDRAEVHATRKPHDPEYDVNLGAWAPPEQDDRD